MKRSPEEMELLMSRCLDGMASDEEMRELDELLKSSDECRRDFVTFSTQDVQVRRVLNEESAIDEVEVPEPRGFSMRTLYAGMAIAAALAVVAGVWWWIGAERRDAGFIARVLGTTGGAHLVTVVDGEEKARVAVQAGDGIQAGWILDVETNATVILAYTYDMSVISLSNGAVAEIGGGEETKARMIRLRRGSLAASTARQSAGRTILITTPHAEMMVVGTRLSVQVGAESTRLDVQKGIVRIRAKGKDGYADIGQGGSAIAGGGGVVVPGRASKTLFGSVGWGQDGATGVAVKDGGVWVFRHGKEAGSIIELDIKENKILQELPGSIPARHFGPMAFDGTDFWVSVESNESKPVLLRIDAVSGEVLDSRPCPAVTNTRFPLMPFDFAGGYLWVADDRDLCKVDPATWRVCLRVRCPWKIGHIGGDDGAVYAGQWQGWSRGADTIKFDTSTGSMMAHFRIGGQLAAGDMAIRRAGDGKSEVLMIDWTNNHLDFYEGE